MLHPLLEKHIPSRSYVEFLKAHDAAFTDFETAAILESIGLPLKEKLSVWRSLLEETADGDLKQQLADEIALKQKGLDLFRTKTDGSVYMIRDGCGDAAGLADNYETAYAIALTCESGFEIEKYEPLSKYSGPTLKEYRMNPYLAPDLPPLSIPEKNSGPVVAARFHRDGTLLFGHKNVIGFAQRPFSSAD